jgi:hypothetical protein
MRKSEISLESALSRAAVRRRREAGMEVVVIRTVALGGRDLCLQVSLCSSFSSSFLFLFKTLS